MHGGEQQPVKISKTPKNGNRICGSDGKYCILLKHELPPEKKDIKFEWHFFQKKLLAKNDNPSCVLSMLNTGLSQF